MLQDDILIIMSDKDGLEPMIRTFVREGYGVQSSIDGDHGLRRAAQMCPSLIVIDLELHDMDGIAVCRALRDHHATASVPIILLSKERTEDETLRAFAAGADDFVVKPFRAKILVARVRAILRRLRPEPAPPVEMLPRRQIGPVIVDHERHQAYARGAPLPLTLAEYRLLAALVSRPGRVFSREQLIEKISGDDADVTDRNVDVHVKMVRKKLGADRDFIQTVRGVGYKCRDS